MLEKGGGSFAGIKLLLCENPLPPIDAAVAAAQAEAPRANYYTEAYSAPLKRLIVRQLGVPERLIHIKPASLQSLRFAEVRALSLRQHTNRAQKHGAC